MGQSGVCRMIVSPHVDPYNGQCTDSDMGVTDRDEDGCAEYTNNPS